MRLVNLFRYLDQALFAAILFSINLLTPYLVEIELAAEILYLSSWVMLWGAISVAFFGIPMVATVSEGESWKAREILIFYLLLSAVFFSVLWFLIKIGLVNSKVITSVVFFAIAWGFADLLRRSFLIKGGVTKSLVVALICVLSVLVGLFYLYFSQIGNMLWIVGSVGPSALIILFLLNRVHVNGDVNKRTFRQICKHSKDLLRTGSYNFLSYLLVWTATQGLFVFFFQTVDASVFVDQKWVFSLFGLYGILMVVQENRFQPAYSKAFSLNNTDQVAELDKKIKYENSIMLYAGIITGIAIYVFSNSYPISLIFLVVMFRQVFGNAKRFVYVMRGDNQYKQVMFSHFFACLVSYAVSLLLIGSYDYAISLGLVGYAATFYTLTFLSCNKIKRMKC